MLPYSFCSQAHTCLFCINNFHALNIPSLVGDCGCLGFTKVTFSSIFRISSLFCFLELLYYSTQSLIWFFLLCPGPPFSLLTGTRWDLSPLPSLGGGGYCLLMQGEQLEEATIPPPTSKLWMVNLWKIWI